MFKPLVFFLLLALLLSGCYKVNKDVVKKPPDLIPPEKMVDILTDMEIIEGAVSYSKTHFQGYPDNEEKYYKVLLDHYHITRRQLKASLNYYNSKGDEMIKIYKQVLKKLNEKQKAVMAEQEMLEAKKYHRGKAGLRFPYLFETNSLKTICFNPVP